jgi:hypothetical protein
MTQGPEAKDAPHPPLTRSAHQAKPCSVWRIGMLGPSWPGWARTCRRFGGVRAATPVLEPGDRLVVGLAAHVGGYVLRSSVTTEPLVLVADLVHALGYALWTGVVVVLFVQVIPEAKRRQFKQALDAYEAAQRDQARAGGDQASGDDAAPTAR